MVLFPAPAGPSMAITSFFRCVSFIPYCRSWAFLLAAHRCEACRVGLVCRFAVYPFEACHCAACRDVAGHCRDGYCADGHCWVARHSDGHRWNDRCDSVERRYAASCRTSTGVRGAALDAEDVLLCAEDWVRAPA